MKLRIIAVVAALAVAVLGATAVVKYAKNADNRAVAGQKVASVYIALKDVPQGTSAHDAAEDGLIAQRQVVAKGVPDGALTQLPGNAGDQVALSTINAGSVVLGDRFGAPTEIRSTGGVPAGQVAVTLKLKIEEGVEPLLTKGAHIAIYDTFNGRDDDARTSSGRHLADDKPSVRGTRVVLPDAKVISVAFKPVFRSSSRSTLPSDVGFLVTVAVSPAESVRLVHAIQTGDLYAGLLGNGAKVSSGAGTSDTSILGQ